MKQQTALITGCSSGIGEDIAVRLAQEGWRVYAGVRSESDGERLSKLNQNLHPLILDVTNRQHIDDCLALFDEENIQLDALINNAGIAAGGPVEIMLEQEWRSIFEVNVFGLVNLTTACLPLLRKSKGRIVNISSISGLLASPFMSIYASSKFAVEAFSDSLRRETKDFGIEVCIVEPGPIATKIWDKGTADSMKKLEMLQGELATAYSGNVDAFRKAIDGAVKLALPASETSEAILHACTASKPKTRYLVSKNKPILKLLRMLPDRWSDALILKMR